MATRSKRACAGFSLARRRETRGFRELPTAAGHNRKQAHVTSITLSTKDAAQMAQQARAIHECLDRHIPEGRHVALLMFPFDFNVGNHMMWVATLEYLKRRNARVAYTAHGRNFDLPGMIRA